MGALRKLTLGLAILGLAIAMRVGVAVADDKVSLQLRWEPQFQFAGYYMALEKGFYARRGLDVEIRAGVQPGPRYLSAVNEVADGRATFGIGSVDVALARADGAPLSIISSIFQNSPVEIYTKADTRVSTLSALMALRFSTGLQRNGPAEIELRALLRAEGLNIIDVKVPESGKRSFDAFRNGEVDVFPGFSLATPWVARRHGLEIKPIKASDFGIHFYGDSIFAREDLIRQDPRLVDRFVEASLEGWAYALNNPEEAIDLIVSNYERIDGQTDLRAFNRWQSQVVSSLTDFPEVALGNTSEERWARMVGHLLGLGLIGSPDRLTDLVLDPAEIALEQSSALEQWLIYGILGLLAMGLALLIFALVMRREVARRTADLLCAQRKAIEAQEVAEEANRAKSDFLATMSHELRTPLNAVIGFADLLNSDVSKAASPEKVSSYARNIGESGRALLALINNVLDFAKIDAEHLVLDNEPFDLRQAIVSVKSALEIKAAEAGVRLTLSQSGTERVACGDEMRMRQVISNLLDNAIKFSGGGSVQLRVEAEAVDDGRMRVRATVTDTGIGIDEARLQAIFEPFVQSQSSISRQYGGTGLGLAISRSITRHMGGDLVATSKLGAGSSFVATFEFADLTEQFARKQAAQVRQTEAVKPHLGLRILVVDDVETNLMIAEAMLQELGCTVVKAYGGQEALRWIARNEADAILMDLQMAGMDGLTTVRRIAELCGDRPIPCFAWTADVSLTRSVASDDFAWAGTILKPVTLQNLHAALHQVLPAAASDRRRDEAKPVLRVV